MPCILQLRDFDRWLDREETERLPLDLLRPLDSDDMEMFEAHPSVGNVIRAGGNNDITAHFVGSIVYIEQGLSQVSSQSPLLVIDGQQRLTTLTLLVTALAETLELLPEGEREPMEGFSPRKLRNYYLVNPEEEGEKHNKLLLSQTDKATLIALVCKSESPQVSSLRVTENFALFKALLEDRKRTLGPVCRGLAKLLVVDVALNRDQDNP